MENNLKLNNKIKSVKENKIPELELIKDENNKTINSNNFFVKEIFDRKLSRSKQPKNDMNNSKSNYKEFEKTQNSFIIKNNTNTFQNFNTVNIFS